MGTYAHGSDISYSNADAGPRGGLPAAALQSNARQRCDLTTPTCITTPSQTSLPTPRPVLSHIQHHGINDAL